VDATETACAALGTSAVEHFTSPVVELTVTVEVEELNEEKSAAIVGFIHVFVSTVNVPPVLYVQLTSVKSMFT